MRTTDMAGCPSPSTLQQRHDHHRILRCPRCDADINQLQTGSVHSMEAASVLPKPSREDTGGATRELSQRDKLKQLICSPNERFRKPGMTYPRTLRPDVAEIIVEANGARTDQILMSVAEKLEAAIRHAGDQSIDTLVRSRLKGKYLYGQPLQSEHVFKSVGGILYDMEWTGNPSQQMATDPKTLRRSSANVVFASTYVFEQMLLVDYGFPPCPIRLPWHWPRKTFLDGILPGFNSFSRFLTATACQWKEGHLPDPVAWEYIARQMNMFAIDEIEVWDAATLIYHYHTRREPIDSESEKRGWTGYTGVLQEMINEVPKRGTDRLARKLSLDINLLIPAFVSDREKRELMLYKARRLAQEYHLSVVYTSSQETRGWLGTLVDWFCFNLAVGETAADKDMVTGKEKQL